MVESLVSTPHNVQLCRIYVTFTLNGSKQQLCFLISGYVRFRLLPNCCLIILEFIYCFVNL